MHFYYPPGATPLDPDEAAGLIPTHITTQEGLNAWEEVNILQGMTWVERQKKRDLLDEGFVRDLHYQMFDKTWRWARTFRASNKNIGIDWTQIAVRLRNLLENVRFQIEHQSFEVDELVVRFHHELVWIHAFPNGNGRHARLLADVLVMRLGRSRFSWGGGMVNSLVTMGEVRDRYLAALRAADNKKFEDLLHFSRN